jgi:hypothetical protein
MSQDLANSVWYFLAHETAIRSAAAGFTYWMRQATFVVELYEPELLASADAHDHRYNGRPRSVINLVHYPGLANHPEVIAAARALRRTVLAHAVAVFLA